MLVLFFDLVFNRRHHEGPLARGEGAYLARQPVQAEAGLGQEIRALTAGDYFSDTCSS